MADVELRIEGTNDSEAAVQGSIKGIRSIESEARKADASTTKMSGGLDRAGESADNAETRFTGLASGIDGVTTLMDDPSPQEFAQGIADMADGAANSLVPALKASKEWLGNFVSGVGGVKSLLIGGAVVGAVAGLAVAVNAARDAANNKVLDRFADQLERTGYAASEASKQALRDAESFGLLDDILTRTAENGGAKGLEQLKALAEEADLGSGSIEKINERIRETGTVAERAADDLGELRDQYTAMTDPIFAAINSMQGLSDAQAAYNELAASGTATQDQLQAASIRVAEAAAQQDAALLQLQESVTSGDTSMAEFEATLSRWVREGKVTAGQAETVRRKMREVGSAADDVPDHVRTEVSVSGTQYAIGQFDRLAIAINDALQAANNFGSGPSGTHISVGGGGGAILGAGGIVGGLAFAAAGGPKAGRILAGEFGPEIIDGVMPGTMVHPAANTAHMLGNDNPMAGLTVNNYIQGSLVAQRDLVGEIVQELRAKGVLIS